MDSRSEIQTTTFIAI